MIIERSMNEMALSNTYLVGDEKGGGFIVDAGGPMEPLIEAAEQQSIEPTHVLLTHHHPDHVWELDKITARWPDIEVLIDDRELKAMEGKSAGLMSKVTGPLKSGEDIQVGALTVTPLHTPGHTAGMQSLLVEGNVFTGDTLFKNSVGGVRAPLSTSYADLKSSVMDTLMKLPPETVIRPGHTDPSTVAEEWENNSFVRVWRGLDEEGDEQCTAMGEPATLVLLGDDYDGGHKAWVRWPDGSDDIVPGSLIKK
jgi:glyoxylase-like metal-dependent hydrolase (beta-lactamase superfamily II)